LETRGTPLSGLGVPQRCRLRLKGRKPLVGRPRFTCHRATRDLACRGLQSQSQKVRAARERTAQRATGGTIFGNRRLPRLTPRAHLMHP
jgi:hypothetical protein